MHAQELASKGLPAADIDAALQDVFGDAMAVALHCKGYEDDDEEGVTTETRFGGPFAPAPACLRVAACAAQCPHQ